MNGQSRAVVLQNPLKRPPTPCDLNMNLKVSNAGDLDLILARYSASAPDCNRDVMTSLGTLTIEETVSPAHAANAEEAVIPRSFLCFDNHDFEYSYVDSRKPP
jgi:hypothetical protein